MTDKINLKKVLTERLDFWTRKFKEVPTELARGHIDELCLLLEDYGDCLEVTK